VIDRKVPAWLDDHRRCLLFYYHWAVHCKAWRQNISCEYRRQMFTREKCNSAPLLRLCVNTANSNVHWLRLPQRERRAHPQIDDFDLLGVGPMAIAPLMHLAEIIGDRGQA